MWLYVELENVFKKLSNLFYLFRNLSLAASLVWCRCPCFMLLLCKANIINCHSRERFLHPYIQVNQSLIGWKSVRYLGWIRSVGVSYQRLEEPSPGRRPLCWGQEVTIWAESHKVCASAHFLKVRASMKGYFCKIGLFTWITCCCCSLTKQQFGLYLQRRQFRHRRKQGLLHRSYGLDAQSIALALASKNGLLETRIPF